MNTQQLAHVMSLVARSSTVAAIVQATGLTRQTIYKALRALEQQKVARIADWNRDESGRAVEPVWALGSEPSAPRRRYTNAQKQRAYRQRQRAGVTVMQAMAKTIAGSNPPVKAEAVQQS